MANPSIDSLLTDCNFERILNAQAAASSGSAAPASPVDVGKYEAFAIMVSIGAIVSGGAAAFKLQHGDLSNGSDLADVEGSALTPMNDTDGNKMFITEVIRPLKNYISPVVTRSGANVTVEGMWLIGYGKRGVKPVTQGSTVKSSKQLGSPLSGTP